MTDLDLRLFAELRDQAETGTPVDPATLLAAAVTSGRRIRRRRRITVAAAAALVLTLAGVVVVLPHRGQVSPAGPTMPTAAGVPGAAKRPDLVGTDPGVVHMSLGGLASGSDRTWLTVLPKLPGQYDSTKPEEIIGLAKGPVLLQVVINNDRDDQRLDNPLPVDDRHTAPLSGTVGRFPATMTSQVSGPGQGPRTWSVRWQPAAGLWAHASVQTPTRTEAEALLTQVDFGRATRCAVPYRFTELPAGMTVRGCSVELSATDPRLSGAGLTISDDRRTVSVHMSHGSTPPYGDLVSVQAGPNRAAYSRTSDDIWSVQVGAFHLMIDSPTTRAETLRLVSGFRMHGDLDDPRTW